MELDVEELDDPTFELVAKKIAEREAELRLREEQIVRERATLEQAKKYLETTKISFARVLNAILQGAEPGTLDLDLLVSAGDRIAGPTGPTGPTNYGEIRKAVYETISRFTQRPFSTSEVLQYLRLWHPQIKVDSNRANISSYLKDFVSEGLIELKEEGSGNRPAIYQKK
jgi:hypothetical protein